MVPRTPPLTAGAALPRNRPAPAAWSRPASGVEPLRYAVLSMLAILAAAVFFFPIFWSLSTSLRSPLETFTVTGLGIPWIDFTPTLRNWTAELALPDATRALRNSTLVSAGATVLALVLGTPAAYGLARFRFRRVRNRSFTLWFFTQRLLPPVATIVPFYLMIHALGLLDTLTGLVLLDATALLPFVVVVLRQTFLDLPVEIEEAALVDGAGHLGTFWRVALPLAAPAVAATGLIVFAGAWNDFLFALTLYSQHALTMPIRVAELVDTRGVLFWVLGTRGMIATLPPLIVALVAQRYIVRGLTMGSVTG